MTPSQPPAPVSRSVGRFRVHAIQAGDLMLDGGAMFGVVPKPLWERRISADARNRIPMGMRCLLIEHDIGLVLVDTGSGNKDTEKFKDMYGIVNVGSAPDGVARTWLEDGLHALGHRVEDVALVINTHLHFDHAGGNTWIDAAGVVRPTFPNARYVVQAGEHHYATHTNERTGASYFGVNWDSIIAAGRFDMIDGNREIVPGISVRRTPGHVPHHQSVVIDGGGEVACFLADVCPTSYHLPLPWIMGYDVEPLVTLESKRELFAQMDAERWLAVFEHDATHPWGRVVNEGKGYKLADE
ncbi:MAG: MBL fold metallo-hydrolase [Gemmatimonadetes bacterium]|nr:MBL fold metallo-hydrolase [Gemmatimonadota bacterium]